ncbi:MAG: 4-hydroxy-tetrahydrodipicolinate reductase [Chloroflexi bacterium]|nr:4-hydroxy-tetrahydrodipicolinate reductase [Chloroflexota bacterium]
MASITVLVHGVLGKMGQEVLAAVCREPDMEPLCGVDKGATDDHITLPDGSGRIPISSDMESILGTHKPNVMVDFTNAAASIAACRVAAANGVNIVVGTTGLSDATIKELDGLAKEHGIGAFVAPNFAIGAVLIMHLARGLGKYFDYADIVEMHHEAKIDSPSGTALALARNLREGRDGPFTRPSPEKEPVEGTRGGDVGGVSIHSVRMPGRMAHHEVLLGTQGQTLSLRHDTINRECYMPGVTLAIREVVKSKGLVVGLEKLLNL